jgi:hypothetical protein
MLLPPTFATAQEVPGTGSSFGGVGLVETRNARFRPDGVVEAGSSLRHQRRFHFLNWQALPWLEATYRLAERLDGTTGAGTTSDRAFDVKLRLVAESDWLPAVAVGLQDFIGTGLYSAEYLVASKRFGRWDATLGLGWGRMGTGDDLANPLTVVSPRFEERPREVGQGGTINRFALFRGDQAALFGGLEYSLPEFWTPLGSVEGLRAKVEFSGDALRDERGGWPARRSFLRGEASSRVNGGLHWSNGWLDAGVDWVHGTDLLVRVSARLDPDRVPQPARDPPPPLAARPQVPAADAESAVAEALRAAGFRPVAVRIAGAEAFIAVAGGRQRRLAGAAGRVLRAAQPHLPPAVELLRLSWRQSGVEVARLVLPRRAMEAASGGSRQCRGDVLRQHAGAGGRRRGRPDGWRHRLLLGAGAAGFRAARRPDPDAALAGGGGGRGAVGTGAGRRAGRQPGAGAGRQSRRRTGLRQRPAAGAQRGGALCAGGRDLDPRPVCGAHLGLGAGPLRAPHRRLPRADVRGRLGGGAVAAAGPRLGAGARRGAGGPAGLRPAPRRAGLRDDDGPCLGLCRPALVQHVRRGAGRALPGGGLGRHGGDSAGASPAASRSAASRR